MFNLCAHKHFICDPLGAPLVQHTCVTIEDVLEDVVGLGWANLPHALSCTAAAVWVTPTTVAVVAADTVAAGHIQAEACLDGWVADATSYVSYGSCYQCVHIHETFVSKTRLKVA